MKNDYYSNSNDYINRWVISYADFVTMLLALFMVMFATSSMGDLKVKDVNKSIQKVFVSKPEQSTDIKQNTMDNPQDRVKQPLKANLIMPEKLSWTVETVYWMQNKLRSR